MNKYKIAGLLVGMDPSYPTLTKQSQPYMTQTNEEPDFNISLSSEFLENKRQQNPHLSIDDCEYIWYGSAFYRQMPLYDGMMLHSSCIAVDGRAYLFSAPSGTGKSTHTMLWKDKFGDRAFFVNDDKPALRIFDDGVYACGTPFSGKTDLNTNVSVKAAGICLVHRAEKNRIEKADTKEALPKIFSQILRPADPAMMVRVMDLLDRILKEVPVYNLYCNMDSEAADVSYSFMSQF